MIKRIQIKNFKSFGKVEIEPHPKVNLLIGPNSSGKSNFLEAISVFFDLNRNAISPKDLLQKSSTWARKGSQLLDSSIAIEVDSLVDAEAKIEIDTIELYLRPADFVIVLKNDDRELFNITFPSTRVASDLVLISDSHSSNVLRLLRPSLPAIRTARISNGFNDFNSDLSNLVNFIDDLRDNHLGIWAAFCQKIEMFTGEFRHVTKVNSDQSGNIEIQFHTENGHRFKASEVSDGVLYFVALLAILHLPNPPKVILLEEPENGIHPRRLAEIVSLIRRLADEKDVQFFITTHSPIILDQFQDAPECVLVFDKKAGISKVRTLIDILKEKAEFEKENGLPHIDYTQGLSDNWLWGYLDGVPPIVS